MDCDSWTEMSYNKYDYISQKQRIIYESWYVKIDDEYVDVIEYDIQKDDK